MFLAKWKGNISLEERNGWNLFPSYYWNDLKQNVGRKFFNIPINLDDVCFSCWSFQIMHYSEDAQSLLYMHFIVQFVFSPETLISPISDKLQGESGFILEEWKRQKNFLYIFAAQTHT